MKYLRNEEVGCVRPHQAIYPPDVVSALPDRVLWNRDGTVDEIVIHNCTIHLEQMSDTAYWMGITKGGGTLMVDIGHSGKSPLACTMWDDSEISWEWDEEDRHDA